MNGVSVSIKNKTTVLGASIVWKSWLLKAGADGLASARSHANPSAPVMFA
jgi:hypothetical protein